MTDSLGKKVLKSCIGKLEKYKLMADASIAQLTDQQIIIAPEKGSNSIAVIMQHMAGNMESRWTNFLTEDGEKSWRNRDQEFEPVSEDRISLMARWEKGWFTMLDTLNGLQPDDLEKEVRIRGEKLVVYDAIIRQVFHYSSHVGQIIYVAKWLKGKDWQPLTIAINKSQDYNHLMGYNTQ